MASTGNINASNQYITFVNGSRTESIGNSAFNFVDVPAKKDGWMSIVIGDALIKYGTINKVTITYRCRGHRSNSGYKKATARTGYTDTSGNIQWTTTHTEEVARANDDASQFTDTITNPTRDNNGQYRMNVGVINNISTLALTIYVLSITINIDYTPPSYNVTVNTTPSNGGTVSGGGSYTSGNTVTITATPNVGYKFAGWANQSGVITTTVNPYSFTISANTTFTAVFEPITHTVTTAVSPANAGTITGGGTYNYGTSVTLTALAGDIYKFVSWNDGVTNASRTFTITGDVTYTAYFKLNAIFIDTSQSLGVFVDTIEANEIYVDTTKVYG